MSDKYYRGLRNILNDTKYKLQLASMTLKINENKNNITGIKNDISGINNLSKINDNETNISDNLSKIDKNTSDISSNKGLIGTNTRDISTNLGKINTNTSDISSNLGKINTNISNISDNSNLINTNTSSISNISEFILKSDKDFEKTYNIEPQTFKFDKDNHSFSILEREIEHDFIKNTLLFVKNNIHYKYDDLSEDYHRCQHEYNILDDENNLIHKYLFNKGEYYDENSNMLNTAEEFCIFLKKDYKKIKIVLELHRHNRHGYGNINLEINNGYIRINYIEKGFLDNSHLVNLNTGSILTNSGKIDTNTFDISSNLNKLDDIENNIKIFIEPYNETFIFSNRVITTNSQIIFEKIIDFDFSKDGVFNILTNCNYEHDTNFNHTYYFYNNNNDELIFKKTVNISSNLVKDDFQFESVDTSSLKITMYITDNNETIKLLADSSLQIKYCKIKIKTDVNKNNIESNLKKINDNTKLIDTKTRNISFNSGLISNIKSNISIIHNDIYNKTFIFSNRTTTAENQIIFKKIIDFDFSKNGFFNILTTCNYEYNTEYTFNHTYRFFNNDKLLKEETIVHNIISNIVKDEFKFENTEDISSLKIEIYISDNLNNETIKLFGNSSFQFRYSKIEFKTNINENNIKSNKGLIDTNTRDISSNLGKINTNTSDISSNLGKINTNTEKITALQTSNIKAFYNLDQIFIYDIPKKDGKTVNKDNHLHIFEKQMTYSFTKNSYLEIALKVLTEISHYMLIGYFQILCNFYDQDDKLFYTISLSTAMGSINKLSTVKSVFIVPINENMSKIKIDFFIAPKPTQENRSAIFTIKDINSNKIYVKYFQKTEEMSIKDIKDSLNKVNELENKLYLKNIFNELYHKNDLLITNIFFEKLYTINAKPNDFLEIQFKMLLKYEDSDNSRHITTNILLYDDNNEELKSYSFDNNNYLINSNTDVLLNDSLNYTFDKNVTNLKIIISFTKRRSYVDIKYKSINNNRLILKHYGN